MGSFDELSFVQHNKGPAALYYASSMVCTVFMYHMGKYCWGCSLLVPLGRARFVAM
jgi:hypothetical protein